MRRPRLGERRGARTLQPGREQAAEQDHAPERATRRSPGASAGGIGWLCLRSRAVRTGWSGSCGAAVLPFRLVGRVARLDADAAVGRLQLDRRAAAVHARPRSRRRDCLGDVELQVGRDVDAAVGARRRDDRPWPCRAAISVTPPLVVRSEMRSVPTDARSMVTPPLVDPRVDAAGELLAVDAAVGRVRDDLAAERGRARSAPLVLVTLTTAFFGART